MSSVPWLDIAADVATILAALAVIVTTGFVWHQMNICGEEVFDGNPPPPGCPPPPERSE